eukprot:4273914-Pyramimonas_sp.AAC.1
MFWVVRRSQFLFRGVGWPRRGPEGAALARCPPARVRPATPARSAPIPVPGASEETDDQPRTNSGSSDRLA